jgi:hypothetical protein
MEPDATELRVLKLTEPALGLLTRVFKKQCNSFGMVALKPEMPDDLWPWLTLDEGRARFNRAYARRRGRVTR